MAGIAKLMIPLSRCLHIRFFVLPGNFPPDSVSSRRLRSFSLEQFRFDSACHALCNCVLNSKHLGQFEVIAFPPFEIPRRRRRSPSMRFSL